MKKFYNKLIFIILNISLNVQINEACRNEPNLRHLRLKPVRKCPDRKTVSRSVIFKANFTITELYFYMFDLPNMDVRSMKQNITAKDINTRLVEIIGNIGPIHKTNDIENISTIRTSCNHLLELLIKRDDLIPSSCTGNTDIYFLVDSTYHYLEKMPNFLNEIEIIIFQSPFRIPWGSNSIKFLTLDEEAIFEWTSVNFLNKKIQFENKEKHLVISLTDKVLKATTLYESKRHYPTLDDIEYENFSMLNYNNFSILGCYRKIYTLTSLYYGGYKAARLVNRITTIGDEEILGIEEEYLNFYHLEEIPLELLDGDMISSLLKASKEYYESPCIYPNISLSFLDHITTVSIKGLEVSNDERFYICLYMSEQRIQRSTILQVMFTLDSILPEIYAIEWFNEVMRNGYLVAKIKEKNDNNHLKLKVQEIKLLAEDLCVNLTKEMGFLCIDILWIYSIFSDLLGLKNNEIISFVDQINGIKPNWIFGAGVQYSFEAFNKIWS